VVAIVDYIRTKQRRGVYLPPVYIVKEDGDSSLRMWAMSMLVMDRADVLPGYQQWVNNVRERVCGLPFCLYFMDADRILFSLGEWKWWDEYLRVKMDCTYFWDIRSRMLCTSFTADDWDSQERTNSGQCSNDSASCYGVVTISGHISALSGTHD
jgi:hypothetical protein